MVEVDQLKVEFDQLNVLRQLGQRLKVDLNQAQVDGERFELVVRHVALSGSPAVRS
jgi:hypothetical protein